MSVSTAYSQTWLPITTYNKWRAANFDASMAISSASDPSSDYDNDSVPNLLEYASGTSPFVPTDPVMDVGIDGGVRTVGFWREVQKTDVDLAIELSFSLTPGSWQTAASSTGGGATTTNDPQVVVSESTQNAKRRVNASLSLTNARQFCRISAGTSAASIPSLPAGTVWRYDASSISMADGSGIAQWDDVSGNSRHMTSMPANRPTYVAASPHNGRPAISFSGNQYFSRNNVTLSTTATGGHTIAFVGRLPAQNYNFEFAMAGGDGSWLGWQSNRVPTRNDASGQSSNVSMGTPIFDKCAVMAYRVKAGERKLWVGQTCIHTAVPNVLPTTLQLQNIGSYNNGGYTWQGQIHEAVGYDRPLSDAEMAALVTHLEVKWNCDHDILAADGNSLTSGAAGGVGFPTHWRTTMGRTWWIPNFAVSAQNTAAMMSDFATQVAPFGGARLDGKKNWLFTWELRNHLYTNGVTVEAAKAMYQQYCEAAGAAGYKVLASTMISASTGYLNN